MLGVANGLRPLRRAVRTGRQRRLLRRAGRGVCRDRLPRGPARRQGKTEFLGGKSEMIRLGAFDDVDMAMMVHGASPTTCTPWPASAVSNNGFIGKQARFIGKAAHAGGAPHRGVNALYAAQIALAAHQRAARDVPRRRHGAHPPDPDARRRSGERHPQRRALRDDGARQDGRARSRTPPAKSTGRCARARWRWGRRSRSLRCPATCRCFNDRAAGRAVQEQLPDLPRRGRVARAGPRHRSTDMGDICAHHAGACSRWWPASAARGHGSDWNINDQYLAYILPAKLMAMTIIDLLADGARTRASSAGRLQAPNDQGRVPDLHAPQQPPRDVRWRASVGGRRCMKQAPGRIPS